MKNLLISIHNVLLWHLSRYFVYTYIRPKFNFRIADGSDKLPAPPYILLSNHGTFFDPWFVGHMTQKRLSIMMNEEGYHAPAVTRWYLRSIGTFPKKKGTADFKAMKTTIKTLRQGYPVLIFPEGQTTWSGVTQPIYSGIEKIVKKSGTDLVLNRLEGNFLSKPWWANNYRKGKIILNRRVVKAEELKKLSHEKILKMIIEYISHNEFNSSNLSEDTFKSDSPASGLNNYLWICPACRTEDTLEFLSDSIQCSECKKRLEVSPSLRFIDKEKDTRTPLDQVDTIHKEVALKRISEKKEKGVIISDKSAPMCKTEQNGRISIISEGELKLFYEELVFSSKTS